jgi:hypothetical protein
MINREINTALSSLLKAGFSDADVVNRFMAAHPMSKIQLEETVQVLLRDRVRQLKTRSITPAANDAVKAIEQMIDLAPKGTKTRVRGLPVMEPHNVPGLRERIYRFGYDGLLGDLTADDLRFFAASYTSQSNQLKSASGRCLSAAEELDRAKKTHIYELPASQASRLVKSIANLPKS